MFIYMRGVYTGHGEQPDRHSGRPSGQDPETRDRFLSDQEKNKYEIVGFFTVDLWRFGPFWHVAVRTIWMPGCGG